MIPHPSAVKAIIDEIKGTRAVPAKEPMTPERLAEIEKWYATRNNVWRRSTYSMAFELVDELRRLRDENERLTGAIRKALDKLENTGDEWGLVDEATADLRAALANPEGGEG